MRHLLSDNGYATIEAADAKQALDYLTGRRGADPCLILLDLNMRAMPGWEFLAIIKSYIRLAKIPVIVLSDQEPPSEALAHRAIARYLRRPYSMDEFLAAVAEHAKANHDQ